MKKHRKKSNNCHIDPVLYNFFLRLNNTLGAEIVHRRKRRSTTCIEIVFYCDLYKHLHGRLNTLPEAEEWGYWVICRRQTKRGHEIWHGRTVYQLYLTPVHPKKQHEARVAAAAAQALAEQITFKSIMPPKNSLRSKKKQENLHICNFCCTFVPENKKEHYETYFD